MDSKGLFQFLVCVVGAFKLVLIGFMSRSLAPLWFVTTLPGLSLVALFGGWVVAPGAVMPFLFPTRFFNADMVVGTVVSAMASLILLGVHVEHVDFAKVATVLVFGIAQIFWANGICQIQDFKHLEALGAGAAAEAKPAAASAGDDKLRKGKISLQEMYAQTGAGFAVMAVLGVDLVLHIEKMPGAMNAHPFILVGLSTLALVLYSTPPVELKYRGYGEYMILVWALAMHGILALAMHRDPVRVDFALCALGSSALRVLPNVCFAVRDAPEDLARGDATLGVRLGEGGIKKVYFLIALVIVPGASALLLPTGRSVLAVNLVAPFGAYAAYDALDKNLNRLADSTTFYDYTQVATLMFAAVQFFQILQDHST
jgi:1,4-dihydroxy-2-naphthoate octaprenyltransferase